MNDEPVGETERRRRRVWFILVWTCSNSTIGQTSTKSTQETANIVSICVALSPFFVIYFRLCSLRANVVFQYICAVTRFSFAVSFRNPFWADYLVWSQSQTSWNFHSWTELNETRNLKDLNLAPPAAKSTNSWR